MATVSPAAVILDLGLPDLDGVEVCRRIRAWSDVPIIVLTADDTEHRKVEVLDDGADDYVTKPFSTPELLARLRVAFRHHRSATWRGLDVETEVGDLRIDRARHRVDVAGRPVALTPKEFGFLALLGAHPGRVYTHRMILAAGVGTGVQDRDALPPGLREPAPQEVGHDAARPLLITEPGVGYRLVEPDQLSRLATIGSAYSSCLVLRRAPARR